MSAAKPQLDRQPAHRAELVRLISSIRYKPGWSIRLAGPSSRFLCATSCNPDSTPPHQPTRTGHMFELPASLIDQQPSEPAARRELVRWVFRQLLLAEQHEAGEWFSFDGQRVYFPGHQGADPYSLDENWAGTSAELDLAAEL